MMPSCCIFTSYVLGHGQQSRAAMHVVSALQEKPQQRLFLGLLMIAELPGLNCIKVR